MVKARAPVEWSGQRPYRPFTPHRSQPQKMMSEVDGPHENFVLRPRAPGPNARRDRIDLLEEHGVVAAMHTPARIVEARAKPTGAAAVAAGRVEPGRELPARKNGCRSTGSDGWKAASGYRLRG